MSRYRTLFTEERNTLIPLLAVSHEIYETDRTIGRKIGPSNPVPEQIPTNFDIKKFKMENRNIIGASQDQYGIKANGYKSLKYYGDGPY